MFYFHFNKHIIKYYKINIIFTYQLNDETQLVSYYLCCVFQFLHWDMSTCISRSWQNALGINNAFYLR